ncbi:MAG: type II glyceraldehyde-3-phosphate dehydrogenase [Candidatus Aenigmarchaeota archaeon]|nr:type II glyceraldehyde-3-phosphate dehydrogenase [Candidatus Aenigmarchaeota archaeon]
MIAVAVNGYGTIGKRVADAVSLQDDMKVVGVVKTRPTFEARMANECGYPLFVNCADNVGAFRDAGLKVEGTLDDLLKVADIVIDCTPGKVGVQNKPIYKAAGVKAIFQGGEKSGTADVSFNAMGNYADSVGKDFVRVVSCNTTGLCRTLSAVDKKFGAKKVRVTLIRRGPDPGDSKKGPVNAIVPNPPTVPSHHGPDVNTIFPDMKIMTSAVIVPTTLMHLHTVCVELNENASVSEVKEVFSNTPRVILVKASEGLTSTAEVMELARDRGTKRSDLNEIAVWDESINVVDGELFYIQAVHQESDVVPENIDCIRAMMGTVTEAKESVRKTDEALGLKKWW